MIPGFELETVKVHCPQVSVLEFTGLRKTFLFARGKQSLKKATSVYFWSNYIFHFYWSFWSLPCGVIKHIIDNTEIG